MYGLDFAACALCKVREELEDFLKDDDDISKMCLTRKAELSRDTAGEPVSMLTVLSRIGPHLLS
jgi:hypothetical protein